MPKPVSGGSLHRREVVGRERGLLADLVVVDDLSRLNDCPEEADICQMLAIVGRGLPIVTAVAWNLAMGDPESIPKESVTRHRPLAIEKQITFQYDVHFNVRHRNVVRMLSQLQGLPGCKWQIAKSADGDGSAEGRGVREKGREVVEMNGLGAVRSWIKAGRRIRNALGAKVRILGESLV